MKKIAVFILFFSSFLFADVSDIVSAIKQIENYNIKCNKSFSYNIFPVNIKITPKNNLKKAVQKRVVLKLFAIFGNRVNINRRWYKKDAQVEGYRIIKIGDNYVKLMANGKVKILKITTGMIKVEK